MEMPSKMSDKRFPQLPRFLRARPFPFVLLLLLLLAAVPSAAAQDGVEDLVRIENEVKLKVPFEQTDEVWDWLQVRYGDAGWLNRDGHEFRAQFGDENFTDIYFDTASLDMLAQQSGIRHRSREIVSGPAVAKDDRHLLQIKMNRADDPNGVSRSEIKFDAGYAELRPKSDDDVHPMIGLVQRNERDEMKSAFSALGLDPYSMRPILTLEQNRRRVYINDQFGAFATLTLDLCSTTSWGTNLRWTEIELELNEIRYTEADAETRLWMEGVTLAIQDDLMREFPGIQQDQTPKYNTTFNRINAATWIPLPLAIELGLTLDDIVAVEAALALVLLGLLIYAGGRVWQRLQSRGQETETQTPSPLGESV